MSTPKLTVAAAVVELRSLCGESQQKFSNRLNVSLATIGRWEIADRHPSPRYLKELWHLAVEHNRADVAQPLADAFATAAGYQLSAGEVGFTMRQGLAEIRREATRLLHGDVAPQDCAKRLLALHEQLRIEFTKIDIEPPFRAVITKGKKQ
jgi:transcriptional regulator with XRE-family HTH domain